MSGNFSQLIIGTWNIQGVRSNQNGNKLSQPDVLDSLKKFDILGLTETHTNSVTDLSVKGYQVVAQAWRPQSKKAKKLSGGVAVLAKVNISPGLQVIKSPN